jgi:hypothetical protein
MKRFARALVVTLGLVVLSSFVFLVPQKNATGAAAAQVVVNPLCIPVQGTIRSDFVSNNCTSPVGLCTAGTITGTGLLDGTTTFSALDVAPSAGMPGVEPAGNLSYSGRLTIMASHGTLVTRDLGVLDKAHAAFTEMERFESGTGVFANPGNSVFFISGSVVDSGQGFQGNLSGTVCISNH